MDDENQTQEFGQAGSVPDNRTVTAEPEKKSFRKDNKVTLALQIVFAALCLIGIIFEIVFISGIGQSEPGTIEAGLGIFAMILIMIVATVIVGIFAIPFILLMIFCKKPWIGLGGYAALVVCTVVCWIVLVAFGKMSGDTASALQLASVLSLPVL